MKSDMLIKFPPLSRNARIVAAIAISGIAIAALEIGAAYTRKDSSVRAIANFFTRLIASPEAARRSDVYNKQKPLESSVFRLDKTAPGPGKKITYTVTRLSWMSPDEVSAWKNDYDKLQRYIAQIKEMRGYFNNRITVVWDFFNSDGRPLGSVTVTPDYATKTIAEEDRQAAIDAQKEYTRLTEDLAIEAAEEREEERKRATQAREQAADRIARSIEDAEYWRQAEEDRRESARQFEADLRASQEESDRWYDRRRQEREDLQNRREQQAREDRARKEALAAAETARADADRRATELESTQREQLKQLQKQTDLLQQDSSIYVDHDRSIYLNHKH